MNTNDGVCPKHQSAEKGQEKDGLILPDPEAEQAGELVEEASNPLTVIESKLLGIGTAVKALQQDFETKIQYDRHKETIIDNLHRELQTHKNDLYGKMVRPLILDIIQLMDDLGKLSHFHRAQESQQLNPDKLLQQLEGIPSDMEDILYRQGVEPFMCEQDTFDPTRQRSLKTEITTNQDQDKTIAQRLRPGFVWDGKLLRPEMVSVYVYKPEVSSDNKETSV